MINELISMFSYAFMQKALIVGLLLSLCASLLGVSLVLRKNSMIGDGLSHVGFGALAVATVLGCEPLLFTIPIVIVVSFLILKLNTNSKIHGDSAIALMSASALAIGVMAISVTNGINTDINSYLFGSILSQTTGDVILTICLSIVVITLYIVCYNRIFAITFDETFAKSTGVKTDFYNIILAVLCSVTIVLGMRMMGALLISSLIIFPTLSSMQLYKNFKAVVISSVIVSCICFFLGLCISFFYSTPTGASIVIVNLIVLISFRIVSALKI